MTDLEEALVETLERRAEVVTVTFTVDDVAVAMHARGRPRVKRRRYSIAVAAAVLVLLASWALLRSPDPSDTVAATASSPQTEAVATAGPQVLPLLPPDISEPDTAVGAFAIGRIEIDAIDLSWDFYDTVDPKALRLGPGRYPGTARAGEAGNVAIAGHRTAWGAPFGRLDELSVGDEIRISAGQQSFIYLVVAQPDGLPFAIVEPSDTSVVADTHSALLTLTTHHPEFSARQRLIVQAELVGEPTGPSSANPDASDRLSELP